MPIEVWSKNTTARTSAPIGARAQTERSTPLAAIHPLTRTRAASTASRETHNNNIWTMLLGTTVQVAFLDPFRRAEAGAVIFLRFRHSVATSVPTYMIPPVPAPVVATVPGVVCHPSCHVSHTANHTTAGIATPTTPNNRAVAVATLEMPLRPLAPRPVLDSQNTRKR